GNPGEFTIRDLAAGVLRLTRSSSELIFKPLPMDDPKQRQPDIGLAREVLGWSPRVQLAAGLEKTIGYFRDRLLTQQIAELATLARTGKAIPEQKTHQESSQETLPKIASDEPAGPLAKTA